MKSMILANTMIYEFNRIDEIIRQMKLQKLLYFFVGFTYKETGKYILDEDFYKLDYGPVCINIYRKFKNQKHHPLKQIKSQNGKVYIYDFEKDNNEIDKILKNIIEHYGYLSDFTLSEMTHKTGSPWDTAEYSFPIEKKSIQDYFTKIDIGAF